MSEIALPVQARPAAPRSFRERATIRLQATLDDMRLAFGTLAGHKLRSALTLLGIVIGVFTVVSMVALVNGLQNSIDKGMGGLGADVFQIQRFPAVNFGPLSPEILKRKNLTLPHAIQLRELLPQAKQVGGEVWEFAKEVSANGNLDQGVAVAGGTVEFFTNNQLPIGKGRGFYEGEAMSATRVAVLGSTAAEILFPNADPLGQRIRIGRVEMEVIGTIERQGGGPIGSNPDNLVAIPIAMFLELYGGGRSVNITVMAKAHGDMHRLQDLATSAFRRIRGLDAQAENDFDVYSNDSMRATFDQLANTAQTFGLFVTFLSLLVGGIGVMNIMLVSVKERTREIGLRKALGARRTRILMQFVVEAVLLALLGGVIGLMLGFAVSAVVTFLGIPTEVPLWAVVLAIGVSSGIGLVFGIYPAAQASRLDPAVALRDE